MASNTNKDYTQMHIKASDHPKAYAPHILILNIVMSILGAIIGLELIVRTGVAPNTSINRCSGYHGQNGSYVSYACWCISCNHH